VEIRAKIGLRGAMAARQPVFESDAKETGRVEAFSDGVFGIAMTLLVLDIKVPPVGMAPSRKLCCGSGRRTSPT